jgi:hypothetical protein
MGLLLKFFTQSGAEPMKITIRDRFIIFSALLAFGIYIALGVAHHEAWRDEWQAINIARAASSLPDLFERLRYEGHPALWYLCIQAVWAVFPSLVSVQVLNGSFAVAAAGLIGFLAPWPLWLRLMVALTGPAAWESSVKARSYGLGWLIIVALALLLRRPESRSKAWFVALLATLALNTSLFTGFVAFSLVGGWLWEVFRAQRLRLVLPPMALLAAAALGTFVLTLPPADASFGHLSKYDITGLVRVFATALLPSVGLDSTYLPVVLLVAIAIVYFSFSSLCANAGARVALALGWLSTLLFIFFKIIARPWHQWHLFLLPFAVAIAFERREKIPRNSCVLLAILALLGLNCGFREYIHDWKTTYSAAEATAQAIKAKGLADLPIVVFPPNYISSLEGYLGKPLYDGSCKEELTYIVWRAHTESVVDTITCADKLARTSYAHKSLLTLPTPLQDSILTELAARNKIRLSHVGSYVADQGEKQRFSTEESYHVYMLTTYAQ